MSEESPSLVAAYERIYRLEYELEQAKIQAFKDFLDWIKQPKRVDVWDQQFFETWINEYIKFLEEAQK